MEQVFYFHIPKTAGTSLTNLLDKHFNKTIHHIEGRGSFDEESLSNIDAVSGHLSYSKVASILDLTRWTTIATFREPYSHVISHISWVRKLADEGEEERFRRHPKIFQDLALYMKALDLSNSADIDKLINHFLSINFHYYHNTQTLYMDHSKRLDSAVMNMKNINVLGLTESMDSFYTRLHSLFDWPVGGVAEKILNKNSNKYGLDITDEKIRGSLYPLIDKDLLLYEEAVKLVAQQEKESNLIYQKEMKNTSYTDNHKIFRADKMIGIEQLNNSGVKYIGEERALKENKKTLIVVGVARGGTSLISGSLDHLGVFTGDLSRKPVFEDVKLANAFENNNTKAAEAIIEEYDEKHDIWSFKRPMSIKHLDRLNELTRNPIYLFIFKDIFSISNRENISMKKNIIDGLKEANDYYGKLIKFITNTEINAFLFSYDKIISNKEVFVDTLISLVCEKSITNERRESALKFIQLNPKEYLNASRNTRSVGQIGFINEFKVMGWGKYVSSEKPAQVELYINDQLLEVKLAKDYREHVKKANIHSTGECGFLFDLKNSPLKDGDKVSVKLTDDVVFLKNSGQTFTKRIYGINK